MWYGFYSRKQEDLFAMAEELDGQQQNIVIYQLADGSEARCTEVSINPCRRSCFDDWQCLGEVVRFLRQERPAALPNRVE